MWLRVPCEVIKLLAENKSLPETVKLISLGTHNHVLQCTLCQPAVEKDRDEDVPY